MQRALAKFRSSIVARRAPAEAWEHRVLVRRTPQGLEVIINCLCVRPSAAQLQERAGPWNAWPPQWLERCERRFGNGPMTSCGAESTGPAWHRFRWAGRAQRWLPTSVCVISVACRQCSFQFDRARCFEEGLTDPARGWRRGANQFGAGSLQRRARGPLSHKASLVCWIMPLSAPGCAKLHQGMLCRYLGRRKNETITRMEKPLNYYQRIAVPLLLVSPSTNENGCSPLSGASLLRKLA